MLANTMQDMADDMIEPANATLRTLRLGQRGDTQRHSHAAHDNGPGQSNGRGPGNVRLDARKAKLQGEQEETPRRRAEQQAGQRDARNDAPVRGRRRARPYPKCQNTPDQTHDDYGKQQYQAVTQVVTRREHPTWP